MPGADKMLDHINMKGIRSAVISNLRWSGDALALRLDRLLLKNKFEFVMTSSDYLFRKPSRILFDIALQKAGLGAEDVWYCGDNPESDIMGAAQAGIYPVWYDNDTEKEFGSSYGKQLPQCGHLHIHEWEELTQILDEYDK